MTIVSTLFSIVTTTFYVTAFNFPIPQVSHVDHSKISTYSNMPAQVWNSPVFYPKCNFFNTKWSPCPPNNLMSHMNGAKSNEGFSVRGHFGQLPQTLNQFPSTGGLNTMTTVKPLQNNWGLMFLPQLSDPLKLSSPSISILEKPQTLPLSDNLANKNSRIHNNLNMPLDNVVENYKFYPESVSRMPAQTANKFKQTNPSHTSPFISHTTVIPAENLYEKFGRCLDELERKFYAITFDKLLGISPMNRKENGISFVQSGLFLLLALMALSSELDIESRQQISNRIKLTLTQTDKLSAITKDILASLPSSNNDLKFRWSTRLLLWPNYNVSEQFKSGPAAALQMQVDSFNGTETPAKLADILNDMVEIDSDGSIRNTFEEDDLSDGVQGILLTTLYLRGRWRSSPTMLNGSRPFQDTAGAPIRSMRCIRVNDVMRYADLAEWNAEAIEIFYATPGLSLLILVPRDNSLRQLADQVANTSIHYITQRMQTIRIAVTMPLYTLRMTLLLPNKLQAMGISRLMDTNNTVNSLKLSHAVQRLMFWAEAGRNAFKDDGIEWDETPELEIVVDRPYIFFVRWHNLTLMNGNFVL